MKNVAVSLFVTIALMATTVGAQSPTTANTSPPQVTFDHWGGNEWWVEVKIKSSHPIMRAEVAVMNERFHGMSRASWDPSIYTAGIHIPPGELVQFRIMHEGTSTWVTSCFFTHPQGVERCDVTQEPFKASFRNPSGNEWWEQVYVDSNRPIRAVWVDIMGVRLETGDLTLRSWGAWAGSFYAPSGSIVRFSMMSTTNEGAQSACYNWPQVTVTECPSSSGDKPVFDHVKGNEWWVEVKVGPMEPQQVFALDASSPSSTAIGWVELTKRSWGVWAGSFHIEPGNKVQFRAIVDDQAYDSCWFTHPQGMTPTNTQTCKAA